MAEIRLTSWGTGISYPIIYEVLAPSKRCFSRRIFEPSTVSLTWFLILGEWWFLVFNLGILGDFPFSGVIRWARGTSLPIPRGSNSWTFPLHWRVFADLVETSHSTQQKQRDERMKETKNTAGIMNIEETTPFDNKDMINKINTVFIESNRSQPLVLFGSITFRLYLVILVMVQHLFRMPGFDLSWEIPITTFSG